MAEQIRQLRVLSFVVPREHRRELRALQEQHRQLTALVDSFYEAVGERNWVFTGDLIPSEIEKVLDREQAADPAGIEARLIAYYKAEDHISSPLGRLNRFPAMRDRMVLLRKALSDYEAGRYYSTVFVILAVMDGFVGEFETSVRKGLHARSEEDMVAWDSVAGHHMGLGHAHKSFRKSVFKTDLAETTELYRNGIMHGTLVNFDNEIIATKAWNRLFAVADWADARQREQEPEQVPPTCKDVLAQLRRQQQQQQLLQAWEPREFSPEVNEESEVLLACTNYLTKWHRRQWAPVGATFIEFGSTKASLGKLAEEAKWLYQSENLEEWNVLLVRHVSAAVAEIDVELRVNGVHQRAVLRWVRIGPDGQVVLEDEPGQWKLSPYGPRTFLTSDAN
ncbi:hypothetical protein [Arthrobacter sp. RCC_34]|uniref:hypothetical protein n=1 Tax=Arthrobacter sp. RCC_34 TaxID=3239230 RepID=UPI00352663DC